MCHHLRFDGIEPGSVRRADIGQQAVAFAQGGFIARGVGGVLRIERQRHTVHEPPPVGCRAGEQPVHRWREPGQRQPFAQRSGIGFCAVDPHASTAGAGAFGVGAQSYLRVALRKVCPDGKTSVAAVERHFGQRRAAQSAPGRQQRQGFEHIGLARAIFAHQQVETRRAAEFGRFMIAEMGEGNAVEHGLRKP